MKRILSSSHGFSLLELVIWSALVGMMALFSTQLFGMMFNASAKVGYEVDREAIRRMLLESVACSPTPVCPAKGPIALQRRAGNDSVPFIEAEGQGTRIGDLTLRAECAPDGGIQIRMTRLAPSGTLTSSDPDDFIPEPMTGRVVTWNDPASLAFPAGLSFCGGAGGSGLRYLGTKTHYQRLTADPVSPRDDVRVEFPAGTTVIKIRAIGNNLQHYDAISGVNPDWLSEDKAEISMVVDLEGRESTGLFSLIGGSGDAQTALFTWNGLPEDARTDTEAAEYAKGDFGAHGFLSEEAVKFRPYYTIDRTMRGFSLEAERLSQFAPSQWAWTFEFYGR